jgi:hypothetical protein
MALGENSPVHPGPNSNEVLDDLKRLQIALAAISADLYDRAETSLRASVCC